MYYIFKPQNASPASISQS